MPSLWFIVPAHGRAKLARICLTQLRRTCDTLTAEGIEATAVVVADDENLDTARGLGFATVERDNHFLSAKFNDGIQLALDPKYNPRPADYVVPCGSDDWVDHRILLDLPGTHEIRGFQHAAFVSEDGGTIVSRRIDYTAGVGIRIYPRHLMALTGYRPGDEDRKRACDTSILVNVTRAYSRRYGHAPRITYGDRHEWQIVDWKSPDEQLNTFDQITATFRKGSTSSDPWETLAATYPVEALDEMRAHYGVRQEVAA